MKIADFGLARIINEDQYVAKAGRSSPSLSLSLSPCTVLLSSRGEVSNQMDGARSGDLREIHDQVRRVVLRDSSLRVGHSRSSALSRHGQSRGARSNPAWLSNATTRQLSGEDLRLHVTLLGCLSGQSTHL